MVAELKLAAISDDELENIQQHFAFRSALVRRIAEGKSQEYMQCLLDHEGAMNKIFLEFLQESKSVGSNHTKPQTEDGALEVKKSKGDAPTIPSHDEKSPHVVRENVGSDSGVVTEVRTTKLRVRAIKRHKDVAISKPSLNVWESFLLFPTALLEAIPGLAIMVLYCVAHLSLYEFIYVVITEATKNMVHQDLVYASLLVTSLWLTFLSGGYISWMPEESYDDIKSHPWTMRWFKKRPVIKSTVDLCCIYFCLIAVAHFHNQLLGLCDLRKDLLNTLPSTQEESPNVLSYAMAHGISQVSKKTCNSNLTQSQLPHSESEQCWINVTEEILSLDIPTDLLEEDSLYLLSKLSAASYYLVMGSFEGPLVDTTSTMIYYGTCTSISIYLLWKLGYHFWMR